MVFNSDSYRLWLGYSQLPEDSRFAAIRTLKLVSVFGSSAIIESGVIELSIALPRLLGKSLPIRRIRETPPVEAVRIDEAEQPSGIHLICATTESLPILQKSGYSIPPTDHLVGAGFLIRSNPKVWGTEVCILSETDVGLLYGIFAFLRILQTGADPLHLEVYEEPRLNWRMLDHWDNLDGSVERGYAGESLWKWDELPTHVDDRYQDYARACASVGINAVVINNVNASPEILSSIYLQKAAVIAEVLRRYGIRILLSVNFASCMYIGGLDTADPLNPLVVEWWRQKTDEVYRLIPDFGGFLVKADSEGQPGPYLYHRNHADGANMLAEALAPHAGILLWRAFVYGHGETDRAKKAYADFVPLDGHFLPNAAVQVKNGPIDFQPREPIHPLFGGMKKTQVFMEFQITQEYLGQGNHIVFLAPMWKEILDFDTRAQENGSTVGNLLEQDPSRNGLTGIAGVANIGDDESWCGSPMHQANWYAFGRLAWNHSIEPAQIAREWLTCTFGPDPRIEEGVMPILMDSWEACIDYMTPLGLHHIMKEGHHYGPDPGFNAGPREDWQSTYYHRADSKGLGFDRTRSGSAAVEQYHRQVAEMFNQLASCPEKYLLWFHHVPWDYNLSSGRMLKDELTFRYNRGVQRVEEIRQRWEQLRGIIGEDRHETIRKKLDIQVADAQEWREVCLRYFSQFYDEHWEKGTASK